MSWVLLIMLAVVVWFGPGQRGLRRLSRRPAAKTRWRGIVIVVAVLAAVVTCLILGGVRVLGWVLVVTMLAATCCWVVLRSRADRKKLKQREQTASAVRSLAMLLRSGALPAVAISQAATEHTFLGSAAATQRLGSSATDALMVAGDYPGRSGLKRLAQAWQISELTGAPIAELAINVADQLYAEREVDGVVASEMSAARMSGRIMAVLPFAALGLGSLAGADPLGYLFGAPLGQLLVLVGVGFTCLGVIWTELMASKAAR